MILNDHSYRKYLKGKGNQMMWKILFDVYIHVYFMHTHYNIAFVQT
jgi:hypothetical protein